MEQTLMDKLTILADSAKYDVACTSSGAWLYFLTLFPTLEVYSAWNRP